MNLKIGVGMVMAEGISYYTLGVLQDIPLVFRWLGHEGAG